MFDEIRIHAANERQVRAAGLESYVEHLMRMLQQAGDPGEEAGDVEGNVPSDPTAPPDRTQ